MARTNPKAFIRNCDFKLQCQQTWDSLTPFESGSQTIRHCSQCQKDVHLIENAFELVMAIEKNYCVAIPRILVIESDHILNKDHLVGSVAPNPKK